MKEWEYDTFSDIDKPFIERLRNFPREPDIIVFALRSLFMLFVRIWLKIFHRIKIVGKENIPKTTSFIIVANHTSHLDVVCLLSALPYKSIHRVFPAAAKDYFFCSLPRLFVSSILVNALPFERKIQSSKSISLCKELLNNPGNILIIFPEGTRTLTGDINNFKPGIGMLIAETNIPILPCYLDGTYKSWPKYRLLPLPNQIKLNIGKPLTFEKYPKNKNSYIKISEELQNAVKELKC